MTRFRLLNGIDGEEADGVDAKLFELVLLPDLRLVVALRLGNRGARLRRSARLFVHESSDAWRSERRQRRGLYRADSGTKSSTELMWHRQECLSLPHAMVK